MLVSLVPRCNSVCGDPESACPHAFADCPSFVPSLSSFALDGTYWNDSRFSDRKGFHLTRGETYWRRRICELLNEGLVQLNPLSDQQLFLFGELHKF